MSFWIGIALATAGVAGLGYSVIVYVVNRRDPHVDQMGTSIEFDRLWLTAAIIAANGAGLLGLPWGAAFGIIIVAYLAILPLKMLLRRLFVSRRH